MQVFFVLCCGVWTTILANNTTWRQLRDCWIDHIFVKLNYSIQLAMPTGRFPFKWLLFSLTRYESTVGIHSTGRKKFELSGIRKRCNPITLYLLHNGDSDCLNCLMLRINIKGTLVNSHSSQNAPKIAAGFSRGGSEHLPVSLCPYSFIESFFYRILL